MCSRGPAPGAKRTGRFPRQLAFGSLLGATPEGDGEGQGRGDQKQRCAEDEVSESHVRVREGDCRLNLTLMSRIGCSGFLRGNFSPWCQRREALCPCDLGGGLVVQAESLHIEADDPGMRSVTGEGTNPENRGPLCLNWGRVRAVSVVVRG